MTRALIVEPAGNLWGSERALLDTICHMPDTEIAVCCPAGTPILAALEDIFDAYVSLFYFFFA